MSHHYRKGVCKTLRRLALKTTAVIMSLCLTLVVGDLVGLRALQEDSLGPHAALAAPPPDPLPFTDIDGHWAEEFIVEAARLGITRGYPDRTFRPDGHVSRAEFATMIMRVADIPVGAAAPTSAPGGRRVTLRDENSIPSWAYESVRTLIGLGVVRGYEDGSFRPNSPVSNSEAAVMVDRVLLLLDPLLDSSLGSTSKSTSGAAASHASSSIDPGELGGFSPPGTGADTGFRDTGFQDSGFRDTGFRMVAPPCRGSIPEWARDSVSRLYTMGILAFPGDVFIPHVMATRAETVAWLCGLNAYRVLATKKGITPRWLMDALDGVGVRRDAPNTNTATAPDAKISSRTGSPGEIYQDENRFMVLAYYASDSPYDRAAYTSLSTHGGSGAIDAVAAFLHPINGRGLIGGKPDASLMNLARKNGLKVFAVVHNFVGGGFSRQVVSDILKDPKTRGAASGSIVWILKEYGYDGVNVDFENIDPALRNEYVAFLAELAQKMRGSGKLLTVCVPGKTHDAPKDRWAGAFDYAKIGRIADKVVIMAYDEHWIGGDPGPIASINWVQSVVEYATRTISPDRILLGLAAYGYDWPTSDGRAVGMGRMLGEPYLAEVARSSRAAIIWDDRAQVPYFKYWRGTQERTVYFENKYSAAFKLELARKFGLGGVAVWRLGLEDPGLWRLLSRY